MAACNFSRWRSRGRLCGLVGCRPWPCRGRHGTVRARRITCAGTGAGGFVGFRFRSGDRRRRRGCRRGNRGGKRKNFARRAPIGKSRPPQQIGGFEMAVVDEQPHLCFRNRPMLLAVPGDVPESFFSVLGHVRPSIPAPSTPSMTRSSASGRRCTRSPRHQIICFLGRTRLSVNRPPELGAIPLEVAAQARPAAPDNMRSWIVVQAAQKGLMIGPASPC